VGDKLDVVWKMHTIKAIVEDKGSEAARCLRQKADELERALPDKSQGLFSSGFLK